MKIGIHGKPFDIEVLAFLQQLFEKIKAGGHEVILSKQFAVEVNKFEKELFGPFEVFDHDHKVKELDYVISVGGDGTILESVTYTAPYGVPVMGVNTGRLGFLATIRREDALEVLDELLAQEIRLEERSLIKLNSNIKLFEKAAFCLNDFTILKKDSASMIIVHVYVNDEFLNSYWADGLVVSTPTGSTGYSLSCGGPLVLPQSKNFIITPVSPHNLTARPMVVSDDSKISFKIEGRSKNFLISLDSRYETVDASAVLSIEKSELVATIVQSKSYNYFDTLRKKLNWGLDVRN